LRWPEREFVSVPARRTYYEPVKPFLAPEDAAPASEAARPALLLDVEDGAGKRIIRTRLTRPITIREENAAAALEVMSRFAMDPRWLAYLPPTMAPVTTAPSGSLLEHPEAAFEAYREMGVGEVVCEEKHMGSRAVILACASADAAAPRFRVRGAGAAWTRTGRPFFPATRTAQLLDRIREAAIAAGLFAELD